MSVLNPNKLDVSVADAQLLWFKAWFAGIAFIGETNIANEVNARSQMTCFLSTLELGFDR